MNKLFLASSSPRRIELLKQLRLNFKNYSVDIDEQKFINKLDKPEFIAQNIAFEKVLKLSKSYEGIIIGADTIVVLNNEIFGKPKTKEDAFDMLSKLNNKSHNVITGVYIYDTFKKYKEKFYEKTEVIFNNLTQQQILNYIETKECFGKAGSYAIQGLGSVLVKEIKGCYFNVVGLPVSKLSKVLINFGINIL